MPVRDILLALVVVTIWGLNFTVIKLSVNEMPPILVAALRFFFAAFPAVLFVPRTVAPWRLVFSYGLLMGFALYALLNLSIYLGMPASLSSLVLQVQSIFTILLAFLVFNERPRRIQLLGITVALAGIVIIGNAHWQQTSIIPFLILILAAMAWGGANIVSKRAGAINMIAFTVWGNLIAAPMLFCLSLVIDGPSAVWQALTNPNWQSAGLIAFLAYPATLMGFAIWSGLLQRHPTTSVAPFTLLVPVTGILGGVLILGESFAVADILGGVFVLAGLALIVVRLKRNQAPALPGA
ncbi:hypothetical protein GCM10007989_20340 [Devosia pacifica]|uniref:EamA domain-containing protein n=1 Tax=Devosia pacifica TaxID=1335967 RepID=A0A918VUL9_9HYPH|nr:EamA family transporter [Devosia pacifica]GHA24608.1 hypothetical protein GCM10007989_20340 [Devosia pacifica]